MASSPEDFDKITRGVFSDEELRSLQKLKPTDPAERGVDISKLGLPERLELASRDSSLVETARQVRARGIALSASELMTISQRITQEYNLEEGHFFLAWNMCMGNLEKETSAAELMGPQTYGVDLSKARERVAVIVSSHINDGQPSSLEGVYELALSRCSDLEVEEGQVKGLVGMLIHKARAERDGKGHYDGVGE